MLSCFTDMKASLAKETNKLLPENCRQKDGQTLKTARWLTENRHFKRTDEAREQSPASFPSQLCLRLVLKSLSSLTNCKVVHLCQFPKCTCLLLKSTWGSIIQSQASSITLTIRLVWEMLNYGLVKLNTKQIANVAPFPKNHSSAVNGVKTPVFCL